MQANHHPLLHSCGRALRAVPRFVHRGRPSLSSQSLDAVPDQRGLVCDLPGVVTAPAGQDQQQQQDDEDQGADRHQGVRDHPQERLLQCPTGAVSCHICCWEGSRYLWQCNATTHCRGIQDRMLWISIHTSSHTRDSNRTWKIYLKTCTLMHMKQQQCFLK